MIVNEISLINIIQLGPPRSIAPVQLQAPVTRSVSCQFKAAFTRELVLRHTLASDKLQTADNGGKARTAGQRQNGLQKKRVSIQRAGYNEE